MKNKTFKIIGFALLTLTTIIGAGAAIPFIILIFGFIGSLFAFVFFAFAIFFWIHKIKRTVNQ